MTRSDSYFNRDALAAVSPQGDKCGSRKTSLDAVAITRSLPEITWAVLSDKQEEAQDGALGFSKV